MRRPRPGRLVCASLLVSALALVAGCTDKPSWREPGQTGSSSKAPSGPTVTAPKDGATDVPTSAEVELTGANRSTPVTLTDAGGTTIEGTMREDGSSWVPAKQLKYATKYTAKVGGTTVSFTTMNKPPDLVRVSSAIGDDQVVGVAAPLVVNFGVDVPKERRAVIQKRLFVTSDPPQEGIWNWFSPREIHYRSREHWQPGTKLSVRLATGGLPWGGKWYGAADITVQATVGPKLEIAVDNATKQMTVTQDGQVLRTVPVSLGKASTPSFYGNMVIMVKNEWEWFDSGTFGIPSDSPGGYRTKVYWPMRLTWSGQYVHAAPWSVRDQGKRNVSHGCTNVSPENADWLWHLVHIGDPVVVKGTEEGLPWGDGWTDWNVPWDEYVKGSAIPPSGTPSNLGTTSTPTPGPSQS
jgi:lipoprotein-anchoring transpeptidase ErfK/SrfK